jgi:hypothetical protein
MIIALRRTGHINIQLVGSLPKVFSMRLNKKLQTFLNYLYLRRFSLRGRFLNLLCICPF